MAERLADSIDADLICYDDRAYGSTVNHLRTWEALQDHTTTYAAVLEDDAVPVRNFRHQLEQAVKASPTTITSLYLGRLRPPQYQRRIANTLSAAPDAHYILATHLLHAVAVAIHTDHIDPMIRYVKARTHLPIDEAIGAYAQHTDQPIAYTHPSIVNHNDGPTLIAHRDRQPRTPGRTAWNVGTRHTWHATNTTTLA